MVVYVPAGKLGNARPAETAFVQQRALYATPREFLWGSSHLAGSTVYRFLSLQSFK